jgi:hypothetical protein
MLFSRGRVERFRGYYGTTHVYKVGSHAYNPLAYVSILTIIRAWTLEDIVFSQELLLRCGQFEVAWDDLCLGFEAHVSNGSPIELRDPGVQTILRFNSVREHRLQRGTVSPGHILETLRNLTATDPRDLIYAAMSTINATAPSRASGNKEPVECRHCLDGVSPPEGEKSLLTPCPKHPSNALRANWIEFDYNKHFEEICVHAAQALNSNDSYFGTSFCSLSMVEDTASQGVDTFDKSLLPTWVPDWRSKYQVCRLNTSGSTFRASNGRRGHPAPSVRREAPALHFSGCVVDRVDEVESYLPPRRWYDKYTTTGANSFFFLEWMDRAQEYSAAKYKGQTDRYRCPSPSGCKIDEI